VSESAIPAGTAEHWLPIEGFEHYEVSDLGRVRSIDRTIMVMHRGRSLSGRNYKGRILRPWLHTAGYQVVVLLRDRVPHQCYVHDLVTATFIGPKPPGHQVCHGPNGPGDNRLSELRYGTPSSNMQDCVRDGTDKRGERSPVAKLNDAAVRDIRARYAAGGVTLEQLGDEHGVTLSNIGMVVRRDTWRHVL
jgi:hypothetical protein